MRVAALTMTYNEPVWAPIWARHYSRQVGAEHCYLLDHGSDDGSTQGLGIQVERLDRSPLDENERAARVSARAAALLDHYDAVVHTDADELAVADPVRYRDLTEFATQCRSEVVTAVGLDVQHLAREEATFDPGRPIGAQRRWARFSAAMCKPIYIRRAVQWMPGFHACDVAGATGGLFLLHLRYVDTCLGLRRLRRTRGQAFATPETNLHQRVSDQAFQDMMEAVAQLPRASVPFTSETGPIANWMARVNAARLMNRDWLSISGPELWRLPDGFLAAI